MNHDYVLLVYQYPGIFLINAFGHRVILKNTYSNDDYIKTYKNEQLVYILAYSWFAYVFGVEKNYVYIQQCRYNKDV